jgi:hypothetical protein
MANDGLRRFLGGSPLGVLIKLALLSILVGFVLYVFGLNPFNIVEGITSLIRGILNLGFNVFYELWYYFLLGAVIVIPVWLIMRLAQSRKN